MRNKPDVFLLYGKGTFDEQEILELKKEASNREIELGTKEQSLYMNAAFDWMAPIFQVFVQNPIIQGFLVNTIYDLVKVIAKKVWKKFHNTPVCRISGKKIESEVATIQFHIGLNILVLPTDIAEDKYEYAIDKFMEISSQSNPKEQVYNFYSEKTQSLESKTGDELIQEHRQEVMKKKSE